MSAAWGKEPLVEMVTSFVSILGIKILQSPSDESKGIRWCFR